MEEQKEYGQVVGFGLNFFACHVGSGIIDDITRVAVTIGTASQKRVSYFI